MALQRPKLDARGPSTHKHGNMDPASLFNDLSLNKRPLDLLDGEGNEGYITGSIYIVWDTAVALNVDYIGEQHKVEVCFPKAFRQYIDSVDIPLQVKDILAFSLRGATVTQKRAANGAGLAQTKISFKDGLAMKVVQSLQSRLNGKIVSSIPSTLLLTVWTFGMLMYAIRGAAYTNSSVSRRLVLHPG